MSYIISTIPDFNLKDKIFPKNTKKSDKINKLITARIFNESLPAITSQEPFDSIVIAGPQMITRISLLTSTLIKKTEKFKIYHPESEAIDSEIRKEYLRLDGIVTDINSCMKKPSDGMLDFLRKRDSVDSAAENIGYYLTSIFSKEQDEQQPSIDQNKSIEIKDFLDDCSDPKLCSRLIIESKNLHNETEKKQQNQ